MAVERADIGDRLKRYSSLGQLRDLVLRNHGWAGVVVACMLLEPEPVRIQHTAELRKLHVLFLFGHIRHKDPSLVQHTRAAALDRRRHASCHTTGLEKLCNVVHWFHIAKSGWFAQALAHERLRPGLMILMVPNVAWRHVSWNLDMPLLGRLLAVPALAAIAGSPASGPVSFAM